MTNKVRRGCYEKEIIIKCQLLALTDTGKNPKGGEKLIPTVPPPSRAQTTPSAGVGRGVRKHLSGNGAN